VNEAGQSECGPVSGLFQPIEVVEAPTYELEAEMKRNITVRSGNSIRIFVTVKGRPAPVCSWSKEGGFPGDRTVIDNASSYRLISIPKKSLL